MPRPANKKSSTPKYSQRSKKTESWNQFEVNERLFGVTTTYVSSDIYSTALDRKSDLYKTKVIEAEQLAYAILQERGRLKDPSGVTSSDELGNSTDDDDSGSHRVYSLDGSTPTEGAESEIEWNFEGAENLADSEDAMPLLEGNLVLHPFTGGEAEAEVAAAMQGALYRPEERRAVWEQMQHHHQQHHLRHHQDSAASSQPIKVAIQVQLTDSKQSSYGTPDSECDERICIVLTCNHEEEEEELPCMLTCDHDPSPRQSIHRDMADGERPVADIQMTTNTDSSSVPAVANPVNGYDHTEDMQHKSRNEGPEVGPELVSEINCEPADLKGQPAVEITQVERETSSSLHKNSSKQNEKSGGQDPKKSLIAPKANHGMSTSVVDASGEGSETQSILESGKTSSAKKRRRKKSLAKEANKTNEQGGNAKHESSTSFTIQEDAEVFAVSMPSTTDEILRSEHSATAPSAPDTPIRSSSIPVSDIQCATSSLIKEEAPTKTGETAKKRSKKKRSSTVSIDSTKGLVSTPGAEDTGTEPKDSIVSASASSPKLLDSAASKGKRHKKKNSGTLDVKGERSSTLQVPEPANTSLSSPSEHEPTKTSVISHSTSKTNASHEQSRQSSSTDNAHSKPSTVLKSPKTKKKVTTDSANTYDHSTASSRSAPVVHACPTENATAALTTDLPKKSKARKVKPPSESLATLEASVPSSQTALSKASMSSSVKQLEQVATSEAKVTASDSSSTAQPSSSACITAPTIRVKPSRPVVATNALLVNAINNIKKNPAPSSPRVMSNPSTPSSLNPTPLSGTPSAGLKHDVKKDAQKDVKKDSRKGHVTESKMEPEFGAQVTGGSDKQKDFVRRVVQVCSPHSLSKSEVMETPSSSKVDVNAYGVRLPKAGLLGSSQPPGLLHSSVDSATGKTVTKAEKKKLKLSRDASSAVDSVQKGKRPAVSPQSNTSGTLNRKPEGTRLKIEDKAPGTPGVRGLVSDTMATSSGVKSKAGSSTHSVSTSFRAGVRAQHVGKVSIWRNVASQK